MLETPGHTLDHISYVFDSEKALFAADTLFSIGCGRVFEGNYPMMWDSLLKLRALPDDFKLYCGHEYTAANIKFALTVEPDLALAIAQAFAQAAPQDVLLVAGKGHEDYQEVAGQRLPFSDREQVRLSLRLWVAPTTEPGAHA